MADTLAPAPKSLVGYL